MIKKLVAIALIIFLLAFVILMVTGFAIGK